MIISKMIKLILRSLFLFIFFFNNSFANDDFNKWLKNFKFKAINSGISHINYDN